MTQYISVIDDNEAVCETLDDLLQSVGYNVLTFNRANDFLQSPELNNIVCLICDVCMPGMTGLELHHVLRSRAIEIPMIFMTGFGDIAMAVSAVQNGALDFLTKPVNTQRLLENVTAAVKQFNQKSAKAKKISDYKQLQATLTAREKEVMQCLIDGNTTKMIAKNLNISVSTADHHRNNVMKKMKVTSISGLAKLYVEHYFETA